MQAIIDKLKAATEPSRSLDMEIAAAVSNIEAPVPGYTLYLGHALKVAPSSSDNWAINTEPCGYLASVTTVRHKRQYDEMAESEWHVETSYGQVTERKATPAMAFCIAALKARMALAGNPNLKTD